MKSRSNRGVTLIELLIAVTLLSLLSVGILMAMRVGLNALGKTNAKLIANRRAFSVQSILRSEIEGLIPVNADCAPAPGQRPLARVRFFEGQPQSMRFVSSYSLQEAGRGYPRILEFAVIPGEAGQGVRLVVNEFLYSGPQSAGASCIGLATDPVLAMSYPLFRPIQTGPASFVLADKLAYCRFSYRETLPPPQFERWWPQWKSLYWPSAVRVDLAALEPDPSRVPLTAVVAPIHINRQPNVQYLDVQ